MFARDLSSAPRPPPWPAHETVALSGGWIPDALIDAPTLAHVARFARGLTGPFASYYLECRLNADPRVDLLASLLRPEHPTWVPRHGQTSAPAWAGLERFAHAWAAPDTLLQARVPLIWLEFDRVHDATQEPGPCFHLCADSDYPRPGDPTPALAPEPGVQHRLILESLERLRGRPVSPGIARGLKACIEATRPSGRIIHVSAMLGRTPVALKVYGCLAARDFPDYLRAIGWPGSLPDTQRWMEHFITADTSDDTLFFDLAFEEGLTDYVGVVFSQPQLQREGEGLNTDPRRAPLLERLVDAGLCTAAKRDALLQWPGRARVLYPGSGERARLHRWLDIKLSHHPSRSLEAKAYLGLRPSSSLF